MIPLRGFRGLVAAAAGPFLLVPAQADVADVQAAMEALDASDLAAAQQFVVAAAADVANARVRAEALESETDAMAATCDGRLRTLHVFRGDALQLKSDSQTRLNEVRARLLNATTDADAAEAEIAATQAAITTQQNALDEHARKYEELKSWFWVPFYGAFLAIRELVDRDAQKIGDLSRNLSHEQRVLRDATLRAEVERDLATHFTATISRDELQLKLLSRTEALVQERIAAFRVLSDALHDAEGHWQELEALVAIDAYAEEQRFRRALERMARRLEQPAAGQELLGLASGAASSFSDTLAAIEAGLDDDGLMARLRASDCATGAEDSPVSLESCPMPRFPYFDMSHEAPCTYVYTNPPDCPPSVFATPRESPLDQIRSWASAPIGAGTDGMARGAGGDLLDDDMSGYEPAIAVHQNYGHEFRAVAEHANGRNFVGAARCASSEALFLGTTEDHISCSDVCDETAGCYYWSYYADNSYITGTSGECWGGTKGLAPDTASTGWRGIVSGGAPCESDVTCTYDDE